MLFLTRQTARILGLLLLILGVLGFFTNGFISTMAVNPTLNILNICIGLLGIASATSYSYAKNFLRLFGVLFFIFGIVFLINGNVWGFLQTNAAGATFYVLVGIAMFMAAALFKAKKL